MPRLDDVTPGPTTLPTPYQGTPSPTPNPSGQTVGGNVQAFTQGSAAGGAYFGTAGVQTMPGMSVVNYQDLFRAGGNNSITFGVYDPNALVQLNQQFTNAGPVYINTNAANNMYYQWDQNQQNAFRAKMALVDATALTATDAQMAQAWAGLVTQSAAYAAAGQQVSPWDVLAKDIASNNGGKGKQGTTQTRNISTVNYTSAADANAIFTASAQSLLGRAPTADELTAFRNNLHGLEAANPTQQTIEETFNPQGFMIDKNVLKSSGGVSQGAQQNLALQQAKTNPDFGAYQAATTYMNALKQAIGLGG
jgi:hypothetical protein